MGGEHQVHRIARVHRAERGDGGLAAGGMAGRVFPVAHSHRVEHQVHQFGGEHGLGWVQLVDLGWLGRFGRLIHGGFSPQVGGGLTEYRTGIGKYSLRSNWPCVLSPKHYNNVVPTGRALAR